MYRINNLAKIDLNYLRYFYFVVQCNGFTRATEKLHVQQPVISRAVRLLEEQIGGRLLERQRKQVILTSAGTRVYEIAKKIFEQVEALNQYGLSVEKNVGELRFATSDSFSAEIMGKIFARFKEKYPKIRLIHLSGPAQLYLKKIETGGLDFGIFFNVPELPSGLIKTKLTSVEFIFAILKKNSSKEALLDSFVATLLEKNRLPLFDKYKSMRRSASIVAVSNSTMARKGMVMSGVGVSILPRFLVENEIKRGVLKDVGAEKVQLPVYLIERRSAYRFKVKNDLLKLLEQYVV